MVSLIHPTALIHPGVELGVDVQIGPYAVIGWPGEARSKTPLPRGRVRVGDRAVISEHARIQSGIEGSTLVGDHFYLMGGSHVAHDCQIGDWVTVTALCDLSGHTVLEDYTTVGSGATTHQHAILREGSLLGAHSFLKGDTEPWSIYAGSPAVWRKVNRVGRYRYDTGYYT